MAASPEILLVEARELLELIAPVFEPCFGSLLADDAEAEVQGAGSQVSLTIFEHGVLKETGFKQVVSKVALKGGSLGQQSIPSQEDVRAREVNVKV